MEEGGMLAKINKRMKSGHSRTNDPYRDRRSGEDNRQFYTPAYFDNNGVERRMIRERRSKLERRKGYTRVSAWSSIRYTTSR
jgi:hypothetical protein